MTKHSLCKSERSVKSKCQLNGNSLIIGVNAMFVCDFRRESKGAPATKGRKGKKSGKFQKGARKPKAGGGERNPKKRFGGRKRR